MNYNNFWDNVLKQEEWNDDLKRWENAHPEYEPFKEDYSRKILIHNVNKIS
jgi:hypothetical protein